MGHDLGLGGPYEVDRDPEAKHTGPCFDGVYGCHRCWDAANDGKGELHTCDWCKAEDVPTRITRASDEPVMYALCEACRKRKAEADDRELAEFDPGFYYGGGIEDDGDGDGRRW